MDEDCACVDEIKKTLRKPKTKQKNNIWKLLVGPPHPQDLWNMFFFFGFPKGFCIFGQKTKKTSRKPQKNNPLETLGGTPPSPRPLKYCFLFVFFCVFVFFVFFVFFCFFCINSVVFLLMMPIPPSPRPTFFLFSQRTLAFLAREIQKTLRKPKKTKNNIWKLLVGPPHPQDLWNIVVFLFLLFFLFSRCFFCFVPIPLIAKTSGILFFFFVFPMLLLVCANTPIPKTFRYFFCVVLFFLFRGKIKLFY